MGILRDGVTREKSWGKVRDVAKGSRKIVVKRMMTRREVDMPGGDCSSRPPLTKHEDKTGLVAGDEGSQDKYWYQHGVLSHNDMAFAQMRFFFYAYWRADVRRIFLDQPTGL